MEKLTTQEQAKLKILTFIKEGNILIAIFMGWVIDNSFPDQNRVYRRDKHLELDTTLKFHESWEMLMECWFKFRDLQFENEKHQKEHSEMKSMLSHAITYSKGDCYHISGWREMVLAIEWYNKVELNKEKEHGITEENQET